MGIKMRISIFLENSYKYESLKTLEQLINQNCLKASKLDLDHPQNRKPEMQK